MDGVRFMLIGDVGAGKTTLINALFGRCEEARKTQAIEYEGCGMDTPGEYFSHPRLYSALLSSAPDVETLVYVHPADGEQCRLPPGFLEVYAGKRIVGVITKTDLPDARPEAAEALLRAHGITGPIYRVSPAEPAALSVLRRLLLGENASCEESKA
jgi:ethanolamine utilization protein EutP